MRERREDGEWGFSFTVDHRWRLDHLTNSYHFIPSNPSSLRLSLSISPQCTVVTHEIPLHWCILSLFVTHIQIFFFFFFKGGWSKVVDDNRINMEFILLRGSPGGSIQFPSTAACWFNLFFFRQTSQKGISAFLHLNWPSADLSLSALLPMQIATWKPHALHLPCVLFHFATWAPWQHEIYIRL